MRVWRGAAAAVAALAAVAAVSTAAAASAVPGHKDWLIMQGDLSNYGGDAADFTWIGCGTAASGCNVRTFASFFQIRHAILSGQLKRGSMVLYDLEKWGGTSPAEHKNPGLYLRLAAQLAHKHGYEITETPLPAGGKAVERATDVVAARYADVVDMQLQGQEFTPARYHRFVTLAVRAMRAVSKTVIIIAGLGTDPGGTPATAWDMFRSYKSVLGEVNGFWLNVPRWPGRLGCAPLGCPGVARAFVKLAGL